ncbi:MAG: hypothetical protein J7L47_07130 [Candidatus Odinarchaeota archaeon]|nr:hypothetical protein [Candidatus Odinarchaeota archaeon]
MELSKFRIKIIFEGLGEVEGELNRALAPRTVERIIEVLPLMGRAIVWKNSEIYFPINLKFGLEKPTKKPPVGSIAYWSVGDAICFFFQEIEPYNPVTVIGTIIANLDLLKKVKRGTRVKIIKSEEVSSQ